MTRVGANLVFALSSRGAFNVLRHMLDERADRQRILGSAPASASGESAANDEATG